MTCAHSLSQFRLLNHLVGWDVDVVENLKGFDSSAGVQLRRRQESVETIDESTLSMWIPPSRLARSCGVCEWYLVTPCPPQSRLLVRSACDVGWSEPAPGARGVLNCADAVAVSPQRIAVADKGSGAIVFFTDRGVRQLGQVAFGQPGPIAYASWREWLVVDQQYGLLRRLDLAGVDLGRFSAPLPEGATSTAVDRLAIDEECRVWIAIKVGETGRYTLWRAGRRDLAFQQTDLSELQRAFGRSELATVSNRGFCLRDDRHTDAGRIGSCYSWYGRPIESLPATPPVPLFERQGQLLTVAIDSGMPRRRWHRVRVDVETPSGTTVAVAVSTNEEPNPSPQGVNAGEWAAFATGLPHPADWHEAALNSNDFLIQQPPGRYLFLRLRMTGDGFSTPLVKRIRLDFPRQTSLDQLPFVYRESRDAEDFGERFLSLFDAFIENVDDVIQRLPALLDASGVPDEVLTWLGRFLGIAMDPAWDAARRRRVLLTAPKLYRMRGTVDGMRTAVQLLFDVDPVINELSTGRPWGALGDVRLSNGVRLFGRSSSRFRLGGSRLSQAPLRSFGNPDRDPFNSLAHRFHIFVPLVLDSQSRNRLQKLIDAQKPAHTLVSLRDRNGGFAVGSGLRLGVDTTFGSFAPTVLQTGGDGIRLSRNAVLSGQRSSTNRGLRIGRGAVVGVNSSLG